MPARAPKDPHAPKKYQSSYFLFSNERRPLLQSSHKNLAITEISKLISAEWKELGIVEKENYNVLAKEGKEKYERELSEYKQTSFYKEHQAKVLEWKSLQAEKNNGNNNGKKMKKGKLSKKPKKPKQPIAMPKRPQSSYFIFSNERRPQLRSIYTSKKVTELSGLISKEWKEKTEAEKKIYEEKALENKARYHATMNEYKKTEEYAEYMGILDDWKRDKKRFERGMDLDDSGSDCGFIKELKLPKKPKDSDCPKRPLTSYFLYAKQNRETVKQEFPNKPITEIAKEISKKWNILTKEEKEPFNEEAKQLKVIYNQKMEEYKQSSQYSKFEEVLQNWKNECAEIKKKNRLNRAEAKKNNNNLKQRKGKRNSKQVTTSKQKSKKKSSRNYDYDSDSDSSQDSSMSSSGSYESDSDSNSNSDSSDSDDGSYDSDSESSD